MAKKGGSKGRLDSKGRKSGGTKGRTLDKGRRKPKKK